EMAKDDPWDETLWEPVRVLGLESVGADFVVIQTQAKTMPGQATAVARELRWRIKRAFDHAGIVITGGAPVATVSEAEVPEGAPGHPVGHDGVATTTPPSVPAPASGDQ
ncbi:MAG TPA: mechanosensitive ion channel family protein, partial [Streptomyces sp.]